ncbi:hypothetical protein V5735_01545 (plasmid) [Haladaptatus sp. SPP-AMP-3]|uniref:hypothetical protein n=1 Tax=Haladaptatus sp. SPP-AMP-3 TaxID=3121295 RepID=UPI003C2C9D16
MKSGSPSPSARDIRSHHDAREFIDELLEEWGVCPKCFNRTRHRHPEYDEYRDDYLRHNLRQSVTDITTDTTSLADGGQREPVPVRGDSHGSATYCEDCGLPFGSFDDSRVRSKDLLKDCLENVGDRLRENDGSVAFNQKFGEGAIDAIGDHTSDNPWSTGDDLDYLALAVHLAVKHGE